MSLERLKLDLPLTVIIPRKTKADKRFTLNLNIYRVTHYQTLNQAKIIYAGELQRRLMDHKGQFTKPVICKYILYPKTKRRTDLGNVLSVVQKFTEDALVSLGILEDDSYEHICDVSYGFGQVDKDNPRVELLIYEWEKDCGAKDRRHDVDSQAA